MPIEWLQFVELPEEDKGKGVAPHIHFLLMAPRPIPHGHLSEH